MNEIIAKLYDQSIIIEDGGDYVCGELDPMKFAELIVRECLKQCYYRGMNDEPYEGQLKAAEYIEEHFGVK